MKRDPAKARAWQQRSAVRAEEKRRAKAMLPRSSDTCDRPPRSSAAPRKRLPPVNRERAAVNRLEQFGTPEQTRMINSMPCCCSRAPRSHPACTGGWSEPSHIVSRGAGGKKQDQVAHSTGCHAAFHQHGVETYLATIGWTWEDLRAEADRTWAAVSGMTGEPGWYAPE